MSTPALYGMVTFTATRTPSGGCIVAHEPRERTVRITRLPTDRRPTYEGQWFMRGEKMDARYEFTIAQMAEIVAVAS